MLDFINTDFKTIFICVMAFWVLISAAFIGEFIYRAIKSKAFNRSFRNSLLEFCIPLAHRPLLVSILSSITIIFSIYFNSHVFYAFNSNDLTLLPEGNYCFTVKLRTDGKTYYLPAEIHSFGDGKCLLNKVFWSNGGYLDFGDNCEIKLERESDVYTADDEYYYVTLLNVPAYAEKAQIDSIKHSVWGDIITLYIVCSILLYDYMYYSILIESNYCIQNINDKLHKKTQEKNEGLARVILKAFARKLSIAYDRNCETEKIYALKTITFFNTLDHNTFEYTSEKTPWDKNVFASLEAFVYLVISVLNNEKLNSCNKDQFLEYIIKFADDYYEDIYNIHEVFSILLAKRYTSDFTKFFAYACNTRNIYDVSNDSNTDIEFNHFDNIKKSRLNLYCMKVRDFNRELNDSIAHISECVPTSSLYYLTQTW